MQSKPAPIPPKSQTMGIVIALAILMGVGFVVMFFKQDIDTNLILDQMGMLSQQVARMSEVKSVPQATNPAPQQAQAAVPSSNIFDTTKNKVGDVVAGLTVTSISPVPGSTFPLGNNNVVAKFSGSVTLSGSYDFSYNEMSGSDSVCFTPADATEHAKLPALPNEDIQLSRFCFSNLDQAKAAFGPSYGNGQATITIDKYELWYAEAEVTNLAELVKVISK